MGSGLRDPVLLDNSAWARLSHGQLPPSRSDEVADAIAAGRVFASLPFLLEAGNSARNGREHRELLEELGAMPWAAIDARVERRAIELQAQLARAGHHRMPPVDLIQGALAERYGLGILHYDRDYDVLAERTDASFGSLWLAPSGSL